MRSFGPAILASVSLLLLSVPVGSATTPTPTAPPSWRNPSNEFKEPNITVPVDERNSLASDALDIAISMLDGNLTNPGDIRSTLSLQALMSEFDYMTNQTKYRNKVGEFFSRYTDVSLLSKTMRFNDSITNDLLFGYAAIRAYAAYNDSQFVKAAEVAWASGRRYTLLEEDISSGRGIPGLDQLQLICQGESMAGGTTNIGSERAFNGLETGLSTLLYESSSNDTYLNAARQSAGFIRLHLYQPPGLVLRYILNQDCARPTNSFPIDVTGLWIQGLSILSSITGNSSMIALIQQSIVAATTQIGRWQQENGVQGNDIPCMYNGWFIRGLKTAYNRLGSSNDLRNYVESYLSVQYNALLDLASINHAVYAGKWSGPAPLSPGFNNETAASEVLIAGLPVRMQASNSTPTSGDEPPQLTVTVASSPTPASRPLGAIVGGIVGGIALIAGIITSLWIYTRKRSKDIPLPIPFELRKENLEQAVEHNVVRRGRMKSHDGLSSTPWRETARSSTALGTTSSQQPGGIAIEDIVRVLYQQLQPEAPPSYQSRP
ncbi:glycoside hydrolase family 76 protein [Moniliophthora roreri MCA 2997]|uniref:Glycoside hydrolase family 76 protein n=1 Tax=Moniliophthora roreri (strain MCA 2997) TaxID=1381753 RepID=V2WJG4_MONRO|nr:glycoside hydrolase family 76 protein [Moniliophthora roreri MCA 2997]